MQEELHFACRLAASVRAALYNDLDFSFVLADYIDKAEFRFMPRKKSLFGGFSTASPDMWYNHLLELGLDDIFAQTNSTLKCIFENGTAAEFTVAFRSRRASVLDSDCAPTMIDGAVPAIGWRFRLTRYDSVKAVVTERPASNERVKTQYEPQPLRGAIERMEQFSAELTGSGGYAAEYARRFQQAAQIFDGKQVKTGDRIEPLPTVCAALMPLYLAAEYADVLYEGCPLEITAQKAGRSAEYTQLCSELTVQIRTAMVYAVNSTTTITAPQGV